jgi:endonuclease G
MPTSSEEAVSRANKILNQDPNLRDEILKRVSGGTLQLPGLTKESIMQAFDPARKTGGAVPRAEGVFEALRPGGGATRPPSRSSDEIAGAAFEAIVRVVGRPPLLVKDGTYEKPPTSELEKKLEPHRKRIEKVIASTGRVEFVFHRMPWAGTGWMIDKNLVVTNRHVAELITESDRNGGFRFRMSAAGRPFQAKLDFNEEFGAKAAKEARLPQIKFLSLVEHPDIALFEIEADFKLPEPISLFKGAIKEGMQVAVVGYPADDPDRNDPQRIRDYFGKIFDVKRFSPGEVSMAPADGVFMHDATTLGGNSGSVVFDLATGDAVGLHFAGTFLEGNFALDATTIGKVLKGLKTVVRGIELPQLEKKDSTHNADFFKGRDGYKSNFLGIDVPLLGVSAFGADVAEATEANGKKTKVLKYRHFSVQYSKSRKLPIYTAVNIDGSKSRKVKRGDDQWFQDLRLPKAMQLGEKDYGRNVIDRGHMVRREDPVWGTEEVAVQANFDTFHYTNSCPQHADLNQRANAWQGLENFILGHARTDGLKVSVFTGPVLRDDDKIDPDFKNLGRIPREFWKVVAAIDSDSKDLYASGYILSQGRMIQDFTEAIVFGDWNTFQVPISLIAKSTGIDFGALTEVDTLASAGSNEAIGGLDGGPRPILLSTPEMAFLGEGRKRRPKR